MNRISTLAELQLAINELEQRHDQEGKLLKEHFLIAYENVKPVNLIKNTIKQAVASKEIKEDLLTAVIGIVVGIASNFIVGKLASSNAKKILNTTILAGLTALLEKNSDSIKSFVTDLIKSFKKKSETKSKKTNDYEEE